MARPEVARVTRADVLRPLVPFAIATVIAALVVAVAIAAPRLHSDVRDPNDTKGLLDVRRVRLAHEGRTEVTVITFASWTTSAMWDRGNAYVFLDTKGSADAEYFVVVRSTGPKLQGSLWRDRRDRRDVFIRNVAVRKKTADGVSMRVPVTSLAFGRSRESYFWWATTTFTGEVCRRTCVDRAPDDGAVEQWRPGMSPTPTTTTTTTPSASS
jgi:hypothetical protein